MSKAFAFVTYETRFAPAGGIAAVMNYLPKNLQLASNYPAVVITPYHYKIERTASKRDRMKKIGSFCLEIRKKITDSSKTEININILQLHEDGDEFYFLETDDPAFFSGSPNPYHFSQKLNENAEILRTNALLFGQGAKRALEFIEKQHNTEPRHWILLLQDWEAATVALSLCDRRNRYKVFLTLHNSYDSGGIGDEQLKNYCYNPDMCKGPNFTWEPTVLQRALSVVERSVFTVSSQFAAEMVEDIFQTQVMAPHLQNQLVTNQEQGFPGLGGGHELQRPKRSRLYGIDNGPFTNLVFPERYLSYSQAVFRGEILAWKRDKKSEAVKAFENLIMEEERKKAANQENNNEQDGRKQKKKSGLLNNEIQSNNSAPERPIWGDIKKFISSGDAVWFVLAGRDDSRQKGYDVAVSSVRSFLRRGGKAKFLFFPMPGEEGLEGLTFLKKLTNEFPEYVIALPFLWKEGYLAALQGAEYGIMPSLYEPFGMANEFYLNGTVGLGRATGGLLQQIIPLKSVACYSKAVQERITRLRMFSALPTGLLYREKDGIPTAGEDWRRINSAGYQISLDVNERGDRVDERQKYRVFNEMAYELELCIRDAINIYENNLRLYCQMLIEGINHIQRTFSWNKNVHEYMRELL